MLRVKTCIVKTTHAQMPIDGNTVSVVLHIFAVVAVLKVLMILHIFIVSNMRSLSLSLSLKCPPVKIQ